MRVRALKRSLAGGVVVLAAAGLSSVPPIAGAVAAPAESADPVVIMVNAEEPALDLSPLLVGTNLAIGNKVGAGDLWDSDRQLPNPAVVDKTRRAGVSMVRFLATNLYDWKRAIGPLDERQCQLGAKPQAPIVSDYGPDEHMTFVDSIGAETAIVVPFVNETPEDAADWVEYMNAPLGTNPRGGVAWAEVRATNGHPEPYDVKVWEVANELNFLVKRYWMSRDDNAVAIRQYAFGGTTSQVGEVVGRDCDHRPKAGASDGTAGQRFEVHYPPVAPGSQTVYVDGMAWQPVDNLDDAGPNDQVYVLDPETGGITFGDGAHGQIPPQGSQVSADYDSGPHAGFVDFYREMKAADPTIDVLSTWAPVTVPTGLGEETFPEVMAAAGHGDDFDGITIHPYTDFRRDFGNGVDNPWQTAEQGHDQHIVGHGMATKKVGDLIAAVKRHGRDDAHVALSEGGALWGPKPRAEPFPMWPASMSHVLYMASQWAGYANRGVPWFTGNALIYENHERTVLGPAPDFVFSAEAVLREAMKPMMQPGGTVLEHRVVNNPTRQTDDGAYSVLEVTATKAPDGTVTLFVVNREPHNDVSSRIMVSGGEPGAEAEVTAVSGDSFTSYNSGENPDAVTARQSTVTLAAPTFEYTFPAHSVTLFRFAS